MYDLKQVIEANTVEGVIDFEKVMATVDSDYVNPIVAKKTDKEKLINEAVSNVVKELGIDGQSIEDLKLYVKQMGGNTDEIKETNLKLQKEFDALTVNYNLEVDNRTKLETDNRLSAEYKAIRDLGVNDTTAEGKEQLEFLHYKFNKAVTEEKTYEAIVEEYAKENKLKTNTRFIQDTFGGGSTEKSIDISDAYAKLTKRK